MGFTVYGFDAKKVDMLCGNATRYCEQTNEIKALNGQPKKFSHSLQWHQYHNPSIQLLGGTTSCWKNHPHPFKSWSLLPSVPSQTVQQTQSPLTMLSSRVVGSLAGR
jgi:hypothetical protein